MTKEMVRVDGIDQLTDLLRDLAPKTANNLLRSTLVGIAGEIRTETKRRVPVRTGNLKKSIKVKRRKSKPGKPVVDVIAAQGKQEKHDGFYWRFVEYGTMEMAERPFLRPSLQLIDARMGTIIDKQFKKKLTAALKREQRRNAGLIKK